jgi:hypothetical protein
MYKKIMKLVLTEKQLKWLKTFLLLKESKVRKGVELKSVEPIVPKKEEKKEIEIKPKIDNNKLKIESVPTLEKVLQVIAQHNQGLKVPTRIKSKFEKEIKFSSDVVSDLKTKLERLIKTTSGVDHNTKDTNTGVFMTTKNKTDSTGKLKPSSFKSDLKKALKIKSLELPLNEVEIERQTIKDFLHKVTQDYSSNFAIQRAEGSKNNLVYGK